MKPTFRLLLSTVALLFCSSSWSYDRIRDEPSLRMLLNSVVKITSEHEDGETKFNGTGVAFRIQSQVFVVSSDHVVLHSNQQARHSIRFRFSNESETCVVHHVTYEYGLSLLRCSLKSINSERLPGFHYNGGRPYFGSLPLGNGDLKVPLENDRTEFTQSRYLGVGVAGFPAQAKDLRIYEDGSAVLADHSARPLLMGANMMYVISGLTGEFGMSGGVLFGSPSNTGYGRATGSVAALGLLTHQKVREAGDQQIVHLYAIPFEYVAAYVRAAHVADETFFALMKQEIRHQRKSAYDLRIGNYDLELHDLAGTRGSGPGPDCSESSARFVYRVRRIPNRSKKVDESDLGGSSFLSLLDPISIARPECKVDFVGVRKRPGRSTQTPSSSCGFASPIRGYDRFELIQHPFASFNDIMLDRHDPVFSLRCPESPQALKRLEMLVPRYERLLSQIDPKTNEVIEFVAAASKVLKSYLNGRPRQSEDVQVLFIKPSDFEYYLSNGTTVKAEQFETASEAAGEQLPEAFEQARLQFLRKFLTQRESELGSQWKALRQLGIEDEVRTLLLDSMELVKSLSR